MVEWGEMGQQDRVGHLTSVMVYYKCRCTCAKLKEINQCRFRNKSFVINSHCARNAYEKPKNIVFHEILVIKSCNIK